MRLNRDELAVAVRAALSLGAIAAVGAMGNAHAQGQAATQSNQKQPKTLQTVVVTGSHIRRVDLETASPVIAISSQQIQQTGKLTLGGVIQQLPTITGGMLTPDVNNGNNIGAAGRTLVGLRGLGPSRTLILVDGQRILNNDMNSIPSEAVERIEVLTDGASSVYGSDAIGGVINIILKTNYQGAQFSANYGISDHDDGVRKGANFVFGQTSDKGSILAGVSYNKFDEILQAARKFSENALSLSGSASTPPFVTIGGSSSAPRGRITVPQNIADKFGCTTGNRLSLNVDAADAGTSPTGPGDYHCFGPTDRYNYASVQALVTPQERTNALFKGVYHLSDNVDAYMTAYHNKTSAEIQLAPGIFGVSGTTTISAGSYYNPFGIDFTPANGNGLGVRAVPGGNRTTANGETTDQVMFGLKGHTSLFNQDWTWDVGYDYGHFSYTTLVRGLPDHTVLSPGLGPSFLNSDGVVQCGTPADPIALSQCTPWDPFNLFSPSAQAAFKTGTAPALTNTWNIERTYHADASGGLVDLPAGTAQLAAGISYRKEYANNTIGADLQTDIVTGSCPLGSQCSAHLQGGFNVKEAYAELFIPALKDLPFVYALNVTLGDRFSKYSDFGSTNNWKVAVEYRPIEDLLLRGTVSTVFRAPTIRDIFATPAGSTSGLTSDPCDHITVANPACVNVPLNGSFENTTVAQHAQGGGLFTGSAFLDFPLNPEVGKSFDFGAVYSPHFVPGLSLSADIWRIYLNDTITSVGEQSVLDLCFNGVSIYCPLITRYGPGASQGQIRQIYLPTANLGRIDVKGIDLSGQYRLPQFSFGQFTLGLNATYMKQFKIQIAPGEGPANRVINGVGMLGAAGSGLGSACPFQQAAVCFFPRIRAQGSLNWQLGPWDASWRMRYSSKFKVGSTDPEEEATAIPGYPGFVLHFGAYVYNDLTIGYNIDPINTRIDMGVDNVFDKQPPLLYENSTNANTDPEDFDVVGRYYWGRVTVKF